MKKRWLFTAVVGLASSLSLAQQTLGTTVPANFNARYLLALADGDWLGQTYVDGVLPRENPNISDTLSVFAGGNRAELRGETASNAVTGAPKVMAVSPDGNFAYIGELDKLRPAGATMSNQIADGNSLRSVDLSNPAQPRAVATVQLPPNPHTVEINPAGDLLAVSHQLRLDGTGSDIALTFVPVTGGRFGAPQSLTVAQLGLERPAPLQTPLGENYDAQWHPSGRYLAITHSYRDTVVFYEVSRSGGQASLTRWGQPVRAGLRPLFGGLFTPNGRFFLTNNINDPTPNGIARILQGIQSSVSVVRLAPIGTPAADARHEVIQEVRVGGDAEGMTISPDGRFVITLNQIGTYMPPGAPGFTPFSSFSVIAMNPETGQLTRLSDYWFEGLLPQGAVFDKDSKMLAVGVSQRTPDQNSSGLIEFWQLVPPATQGLLQFPTFRKIARVEAPRGVFELEVR